jgi:hypothetical protein
MQERDYNAVALNAKQCKKGTCTMDNLVNQSKRPKPYEKQHTYEHSTHKETPKGEDVPCHRLIPPSPPPFSLLLVRRQQRQHLHRTQQRIHQLQVPRLLNQHLKAVP